MKKCLGKTIIYFLFVLVNQGVCAQVNQAASTTNVAQATGATQTSAAPAINTTQAKRATQQLSPISISDATVYVPLGKALTTQAFFTIRNNSQENITITKVTSSAAKKVALIATGGNVLSVWTLAPGQQLSLVPGRQYLQLDGIKNSITTGDELHFDISLSNGKTLTVIAKAKSAFDQIHGR